ncbi:MAG: hypothetical protein RSB76_00870 [Clostridia bacterium]
MAKNKFRESLEEQISQAIQEPVQAKDEKLYKEQMISNEIMKHYDDGKLSDFQKELQSFVKPLALDKIQEKFATNITDPQKSIDDSVKDIEKEGITVDSKAKKQAEAQINEDSKVSVKATIIKAVYEATLQQYYNLKNDLQTGTNGQIATGNVSVGKEKSAKLLLYETYIRKLDMQYKRETGHIVSVDDKDAKRQENLLSYNDEKGEKAVYTQTDKNIEGITKLQNEIQAISDKMLEISASTDSQKFKSQMDELQKQYIDKSLQLTKLEPNPVALNRQINEKDDLDKRRENTGIDAYERKKPLSMSSNLDIKNDEKKDRIFADISQTQNEFSQDNKKAVSELMNEFDKIMSSIDLDYQEIQKAKELLESAEAITGIEIASNDIKENLNNVHETANEEKTSKEDSIKSGETILDECKDGVRATDEIETIDMLKIRADIVNKKIKIKDNREEPVR